MTTKPNLNKRWLYLISGVFTMLFSGVLYAWSILKIPFKNEFQWSDSDWNRVCMPCSCSGICGSTEICYRASDGDLMELFLT